MHVTADLAGRVARGVHIGIHRAGPDEYHGPGMEGRLQNAREDPREWSLPADALRLAPGEVHVWRASLDRPDAYAAEVAALLSDDELRRGARFRRDVDRDRFVAARGALRVILARYLAGMAPTDLKFRYGSYGKPSLDGMSVKDAPRFNMSHSGAWAVYAVTRDREIGVDVEQVRAELAGDPIAERFFSPLEVRSLRALPPELRVEAFFRCWTCKEAYVKARGEGLSLPLDRFSVTVSPHEPPALLSVDDAPAEDSRWELRALSPAPGYVGAFAADGAVSRLELWHWSATACD